MKKFYLKLLILSLPVFVCFFLTEYFLRKIPNDYSFKNNELKKNAKHIETLFLGSSHAYYGINPKYYMGSSFNASHVSQSLDIDYLILNKYSQELTKLKNIVIPIDYFTLYSRISVGGESWRVKNYNIYYDLRVSLNPTAYFELLSVTLPKNVKRLYAHYYNHYNYITCSDLGYGEIEREQADLIETGLTAAKRHTEKNSEYFNESIYLIDKIISFAEKNNINVLFYTSPAYLSYRENLDRKQYLSTVDAIDSISDKYSHVFYFNFLADNRFFADEFRDADHLNAIGAIKFTKILDSTIQTFEP